MCPYDTRLKTNMDPEKRLVCKGKHVFVSAFFFRVPFSGSMLVFGSVRSV